MVTGKRALKNRINGLYDYKNFTRQSNTSIDNRTGSNGRVTRTQSDWQSSTYGVNGVKPMIKVCKVDSYSYTLQTYAG